MEKEFLKYLELIKKPVFNHIRLFLPQGEPRSHYNIVREYPERQGKYFRPGLLLMVSELYGGKRKQAVPVAAVVQTAEDWLLVHDDVEDQGLHRRSGSTLNSLYGNEIAINAGDALHVIMWRMLGDAVGRLDVVLGKKIYTLFSQILLTTIEGQYLELEWRRKPKPFTEEYYFEIISRKTAWYTVLGPAKLGIMLAGKNSHALMASVEAWGMPLSYAFQIWDDILNVTASRTQFGKDTGSDIQESKPTLMLAHLWQHASKSEIKSLQAIFAKLLGEKTSQDERLVLTLMEKYGSLDYAKTTAFRLSELALWEFKSVTSKLPKTRAKRCIEEAIKFSVNRSR